MGETLTLRGGLRWRGRSKPSRMLIVALIAVSAGLLPAAGSFVPKASGLGIFGGTAQAACKWDGKPGPGALHNTFDHWYFKADVASNWCYDGVHVISRQSVPTGGVTNWGVLGGFIFLNTHWAYSQCNTYNGIWNHNCLTKREYNLITLHTGDTQSICIETRIYGDGHHSRHISVADFDGCGDGIYTGFF
jgi:hypothetical protein